MSDQKQAQAGSDQPVEVVAAAVGDEYGDVAQAAVAIQGNKAILVARFADTETARTAYDALRSAEAQGSLDIDGVLVANADESGKVHIQKMTDHTTRKGFAWGVVGGAVLGIIFPPTILASAAAVGVAGAVAGKVGNVMKKSAIADELAEVITPGTSGILALLELTAVDAAKEAMPQAEEVKAVPVDAETASAVKEAVAKA